MNSQPISKILNIIATMLKSSLRLQRRLVLKVFVVLFLCCTISIFYHSATNTSGVTRYKKNLEKSMKLKFNYLYNNFLSSHLNLDSNKLFRTKFEFIKKEKLENDWNNELWYINEDVLQNLPVEVSIPPFYYKNKVAKPPILPFDPRFTLAVYYKYLEKQHTSNPGSPVEVPFHWADWVDLSKLHKYVLNTEEDDFCKRLFDLSEHEELIKDSKMKPVDQYCLLSDKTPLGFEITDFSGPQSPSNRELLGKAYLYSKAPSPVKIIFLGSDDEKGSIQADVQSYSVNDYRNGLLHNSMIKDLLDAKAIDANVPLNVVKTFEDLFTKTTSTVENAQLKGQSIEIPPESFYVSGMNVISELEQKPSLSETEKNYLDSMRFSTSTNDPPKFFNEAILLAKTPQKWLGEHYDWRFFNGLTVGNEEQLLSLHRLVKNYLNFARQNGIITWIAHGSLLSWYWNGIAFPWDTDIDVQVPILELHKLGRHFNQTIIVENAGDRNYNFDGLGRYFVDVGSSITHRTKGNGNNNIDARFIDIDTGLYIDITGLSISETPAPSRYDNFINMDPVKKAVVDEHIVNGQLNHVVKNQQLRAYNCRNNHFSTYEELSPLMLTLVENQLSYIPKNFALNLNYEYDVKGLTEKNYRDYIYLNNFRLWAKTQNILDYQSSPARWVKQYNSKLNNPKSKNGEETQKKKFSSKRVVGVAEKLAIGQLTVSDHLNLLQKNDVFKEVYKTLQFTKFHEMEMEKLLRSDMNGVTKLLDQYKAQANVGGGLRPDIFMNKLQHETDKQNFVKEANKIAKLSEVYQKLKKASKEKTESN